MAQTPSKQIRFPLTGSFTGSFAGYFSGDGSGLFNVPGGPQITTGSISASVSTNPNNLFLINSGSVTYLNISSSSNIDVYSNLFIIKNFTTKQPILTVSQSIIQIATQSVAPTGTTVAGTIWFTSSSFYVGLE
jgi:hypothetical protein